MSDLQDYKSHAFEENFSDTGVNMVFYCDGKYTRTEGFDFTDNKLSFVQISCEKDGREDVLVIHRGVEAIKNFVRLNPAQYYDEPGKLKQYVEEILIVANMASQSFRAACESTERRLTEGGY